MSSINVLTPGQDYDLSSTTVNIAVPGAGILFTPGEIRFAQEAGVGEERAGGGRVYSVEMINHGFGYDDNLTDFIRIEEMAQIWIMMVARMLNLTRLPFM